MQMEWTCPMNALYISGSPRKKNSNSDYLLNLARDVTGGEFLKNDMIPANRGVCGIEYKPSDVKIDVAAVKAATRLGERILEVRGLLQSTGGGIKEQATEAEVKKA